jgi:hypothetical protein
MKKLTITITALAIAFASVMAVSADQSADAKLPIAVKVSSAYFAKDTQEIQQSQSRLAAEGAENNPIEPVIAAVNCPPEAEQEQEACGDDTNGGCLMAPGTEQFEAISCGDIVCGTYWSDDVTRDLDWYELDMTERGFVKWTATGEAPTRIWIYDGSAGCDDPVYLASDAADPEDTAMIELELLPGTYWLVIGPDDWYNMPCDGSGDYTNDYVVWADCEIGTPQISAVPDSIYAEALKGFSTSEILTVSNTGQGRLKFTAQATQDVIMTLSSGSQGNLNSLDDLNISELISPQKSANYDELFDKLYGGRELPKYEPGLAAVECPDGGIQESETCGDDINGGCAMAPGSESYEPISCDNTICGTVWSDGSTRDTDWYLLTLTEATLFTWSVTADFPMMTIVLLPGPSGNECDGYEAFLIDIVDPGDTSRTVMSLPAGDYWFWVGPTAWFNMPCDGSGEYNNDYVASLTCEPPWLSIDVVSGTLHEGDSPIDITVFLDATELAPGTYTGDIILNSNDYANSPLDVPVTFLVKEVYKYIPGDANMGVGFWPPEVTAADITYMVGYFRMLNPACWFDGFYAAADANGDCQIIGSDATYLIRYFQSLGEPPTFCPDYPHIPPIEETYPECTIVSPPYR